MLSLLLEIVNTDVMDTKTINLYKLYRTLLLRRPIYTVDIVDVLVIVGFVKIFLLLVTVCHRFNIILLFYSDLFNKSYQILYENFRLLLTFLIIVSFYQW